MGRVEIKWPRFISRPVLQSMFDLANYFASANMRMAMTSSSKTLSSSDETASTTSGSSDSTPGSNSSNDIYINSQAKQKHKYTQSNTSTSNVICNEDQGAVHVPPKIAFQIFELIELKRRCKGLYRRHQEKRRQSVMQAINSSYHSYTSGFESYCIDGELFV